jgi:membrane-bound serine protease (ClpP class)
MLTQVIYILLILIALVVLGFVVFYKMSGKRAWFFKLNNAVDEKLDQVEGLLDLGDEGVSLSGLRPMGNAIINGNEYEVTSNGEYIEENTPIKVIGVLKNRITVTKVN